MNYALTSSTPAANVTVVQSDAIRWKTASVGCVGDIESVIMARPLKATIPRAKPPTAGTRFVISLLPQEGKQGVQAGKADALAAV